MILLLSPAKSLDLDSAPRHPDTTIPAFRAPAGTLARAAATLGPERLQALMHISPALAALNDERFRRFGRAPTRAAIDAFAGDVYRGLDAATLDEAAVDHAQQHVRILSGLYGLLRPLDAIRPYRLEMGTRWSPEGNSLTEWWGDRIARRVVHDLREGGGAPVVLNLASQEYFAAVAGRLAERVRVIDFDFRERDGAGGTRFVSFHAKRARGMVARYVCEEQIADPDAVRGFGHDGYRFDPSASAPDRWTFVR